MRRFAIEHLGDTAVLQGMKSYRGRERSATAFLIAYIAEAEARRLLLGEACESMVAYCDRELGLTEDEALKRIHAGRVARRFPQAFAMREDGRLHMTALNVLAPHLTDRNADELLGGACGRSTAAILQMLAARFPKTEPLPLATSPPTHTLTGTHEAVDSFSSTIEPDPATAPAPPVAPERPSVHARVLAHARNRDTAELAWDQVTEDELRECEALLSHRIPPGIGAK